MIAPIKPLDAIFPIPSNQTKAPQKNTDIFASNAIQKLKAMLYENNSLQNNTRLMDLVILAETALSNGNTFAAKNFADMAVQIINDESDFKEKPVFQGKRVANKNGNENNFHENNPIQHNRHKSAVHIYKDISNDVGVSFSYASPLTGPESFFAVPAHEGEHVSRRISEAMLKSKEVMVFVSYKIRYDPETGEPYMAGGETWSITFSHLKPKYYEENAGKFVDTFV